MGFSEAVQWWEEWQVRVLVLGSLFLQYFLYFAAPLRKRSIPAWFRFIIWLAYLGSDALAIYALAALFNRHKKKDWVSTHRDSASLEALWAPILLVHLGGVDSITAYNIEDNELWRRHLLTSISQASVAIYVFRKSGTTQDKRLLQAAILIFIAGILKCFAKPVALKSASISSLMSIVRSRSCPDTGVPPDDNNTTPVDPDEEEFNKEILDVFVHDEVYYPFVDMAPGRFIGGYKHDDLRVALSVSFDRLYTKEEVYSRTTKFFLHMMFSKRVPWRRICGFFLWIMVNPMMFAALGLFHTSHTRRAYNSVDVKVTYTLLSCTASLEYFGGFTLCVGSFVWSMYNLFANARFPVHSPWPDQIAQYSLIGYLASKRKHRFLTSITAFLGCEDYLDPLWCKKPFKWSMFITELVSRSIEIWKGVHGSEAATNRAFKFNDNRGHWTIKKLGFGGSKILRESLMRPFDESVLLWHLATEFCYFDRVEDTSGDDSSDIRRLARELRCFDRVDDNTGSDDGNDDNNSDDNSTVDEDTFAQALISNSRYSRVVSNYMAYLLFVNPEMLMTGARPSLFTNAYKRLNGMLLVDEEERSARQEELDDQHSRVNLHDTPLDDGEPTQEGTVLGEDAVLAKKIIQKLKDGAKGRGVIDDAWALSEELMKLFNDDSDNMWTAIFGVWVEMLCFSASRCRGYLHAKSLGKGGEYLSYIWMLLWRMGMETLADKMQRAPDLLEKEDDGASGGGAEFTDTTFIIGDENERAEPHEEEGSNVGTACTTPEMTVIGDEKRNEDGGFHGTTSAAAATPTIGDENV